MNTFGNIFRLTTFGESHGEAIGGVIDGMPAGIDIDIAFIQSELNRYFIIHANDEGNSYRVMQINM